MFCEICGEMHQFGQCPVLEEDFDSDEMDHEEIYEADQ